MRIFSILIGCLFTNGAMAAEKPNIILIMADDLGYEALGTYGSASYKSPVLDEMAETGVKFTHCYSQPLCTPSRVQIMTGRYNHRNYHCFGVLPKTEITFGHLLKDAGYATAVAGKWQLWGTNTKQPEDHGSGYMPDEAGFDEYCLWQVTQLKREGERYGSPLIESSFDGIKTYENQYGPDVSTNFILDFIERKQDEPFFVYFPMALTHDPFVPTPDSPEWDPSVSQKPLKNVKHFSDMVTYMDKSIGRIVAKLDELKIRENTLVIFTGDNGTDRDVTESRMTDGRVIAGRKGHTVDSGTRVPLIANWLGTIPPGITNTNLIDFSDFLPTLVEFAGAEMPDDRIMDGRSFADQLRGEAGTPREWVYCFYNPIWGNFPRSVFARNQRWKLYENGEFYDVPNDVDEKSPVAFEDLDASGRATRAMLQQVLDSMKAGN